MNAPRTSLIPSERQIRRTDPGFTTGDFEELRGHAFGAVMADPPWLFGNKATRAACRKHYKTMTDAELAEMPVAELMAKDSHLHLWVPSTLLPRGLQLMQAWGFEYVTNFVWIKRQIGIGNYWRSSHELMLLGVRGKARRFNNHGLYSWAMLDRTKHSAKPDEVRRQIEKASPGPYLEMFGRQPMAGWAVYGDEIESVKILEP